MANDEVSSMMAQLGISDIDELFRDIPQSIRKKSIDLDDGISEFEIIRKAEERAARNSGYNFIKFLGCGIYDRVIPSAVDSIIGRSEFLTSYTPYQPEISQGMLQSMYEYQSIMSDLNGMDVTNSSMYDGFTALGEAVRMAYRINGKSEILVPENMYQSKTDVIRSYIWGLGIKLIPYRINRDTGYVDMEDVQGKLNDNTGAIVAENPNAYGILDENVLHLNDIKRQSLLITYFDPISLGAVKPPGSYGTDIAVADGQQLGIHPFLGGPLLGIMSFRKEYARKSPGRIIGESIDRDGKKAYVMTLQTR
ncbi:MAG TPA: aminomethyl-transferring glycine dehydrogenase subunit GcvPA, partial [Thermoplasmataceae archaeon]|nr:aminomethyl-transferring glycine dehydrogenase subunit GcvPA [Thermoplasmataceae archaeon]